VIFAAQARSTSTASDVAVSVGGGMQRNIAKAAIGPDTHEP